MNRTSGANQSLTGLEQAPAVVLTSICAVGLLLGVPNNNLTLGKTMTEHSESDNRDSVADALAFFVLILLVVATAVYWVSHQ
jgi:ABC-type spermidine/putrescine transport system permease subunit I